MEAVSLCVPVAVIGAGGNQAEQKDIISQKDPDPGEGLQNEQHPQRKDKNGCLCPVARPFRVAD